MIDVFTSEGPILPWSIILKVPAAISSREIIRNHWGEKSSYMQKKNRKVAKLGETCHANEPCRWGFSKGQFALREILFVLQKNLSTRNRFQCERFVWPTKIFASATKLQRYRQLALEVYNFCRTRKSIVPWQIPFNWSSYFVIDTRLNGIMYECFLSERVS